MQDGSETYLKLGEIVFKTAICNCREILNVKNLNYGQSVKDYHHDRQNKLKRLNEEVEECQEVLDRDLNGGYLLDWACSSPYRRLLVETILTTACAYLLQLVFWSCVEGSPPCSVLDAIRSDCTLGEIMQAMKDEFGTWMAPSGF